MLGSYWSAYFDIVTTLEDDYADCAIRKNIIEFIIIIDLGALVQAERFY